MTQKSEETKPAPKNTQNSLPKAPKPASDNRQTPLWIAILLTCFIEAPQGINAWIDLAQRFPQLDNILHPSAIILKKDSNSPKN
ncbi:hypothetical protein [Limnofasciculus baicalensis]|uniref:Uncharacterized protein n=1 Tax=Limnofasciculus baicalensis BBK-W-15 TaxID=2699891 RepID=A0AAE3KPH0_9CYAN|nr:hypothetical protein [Limnofasciculus baicalensis]MCP2731324.1 hypothetical protein [Limnofasciculus baicalensis BBK-W-15]